MSSGSLAGIQAARKNNAMEIALLIHAIIDGARRLRYLVGSDTPPFIKARREMSDQD
jgi:hypothetical protein